MTLNEKHLLDDEEVQFVLELTESRLDEIEGILKEGETRIEPDGPNAGKTYLKAISDEDRAIYEGMVAVAKRVLLKLK